MSTVTNHRSMNFLFIMLILMLASNITVLLDIPIARQVTVFIYLTFVPGFAFIKLLRLNALEKVDTILFSVGASVALLMLVGLFTNNFGFLLGLSRPLSLIPLLIAINGITLVLGVIVYFKGENTSFFVLELKPLSWLVALVLPFLAILGAFWVNVYGENLLLLIMIVTIALLFLIVAITKKLFPPKSYPFLIFVIALSLLLHSSLISSHIVSFGSDINLEFLVFKNTENSAQWNLPQSLASFSGYGRINSMLSVTILPVIYSSILNIDSTWMFKLIFPLLFSFVAVGVYQLWQKYVGAKYAFISAFLFMAQATFYTEMIGLSRQIIAELFFILLLIVILNNTMKSFPRQVCFILFSFGLVVSHYAIAEIFLFFISFALILLAILKRPSRNITPSMVVFFLTIMFLWYIYTANSSVFSSFLQYGDYVFNQIGDFLNPASRGTDVLTGLGISTAPTVWNIISRMAAYLTEVFIVIGFLAVILKRLNFHIDKDYLIYSLAAIIILAATIIVPGLAKTLNMTRFYHILLFFIAPFCAIGAVAFVGLVIKRKRHVTASLILVAVLIPYFFFQTGFGYEVAGVENYSLPLSMHRMTPLRLYSSLGYTTNRDVAGAHWLAKNIEFNVPIYADLSSTNNILEREALLSPTYVQTLSNVTDVQPRGIVYLSQLNTVDELVVGELNVWNASAISFIFEDLNVIYSNGANKIYKAPA